MKTCKVCGLLHGEDHEECDNGCEEPFKENTMDATEEIREFGKDAAVRLCGHLADMRAEKATIPVTLNQREYLVTVESVKKSGGTCPKCHQRDIGQYGEYPCEVCGLPKLWDVVPERMSGEDLAMMQRVNVKPAGKTSLDVLCDAICSQENHPHQWFGDSGAMKKAIFDALNTDEERLLSELVKEPDRRAYT